MHSTEIVSQLQCYENMNCVKGGSRDGTKVRALASNQCFPGSIPGPGIMWIFFFLKTPLLSVHRHLKLDLYGHF